MIRVVVFDFDGTLVNSNSLKHDCLGKVVAHLPGGPQAIEAARKAGGNRYVMFADVARRLSPSAGEDKIRVESRNLIHAYTRCCARGVISAAERRGARETLRLLKQRGYRVWINSATPHVNLAELIRRRGLMPYLDGALGGPTSKRDNLKIIMREERAAPREVVMVGDGPDDRAGARQAGTWFVAITAENRIPGRGEFAMRHLVGLPALLARLSPRRAS